MARAVALATTHMLTVYVKVLPTTKLSSGRVIVAATSNRANRLMGASSLSLAELLSGFVRVVTAV